MVLSSVRSLMEVIEEHGMRDGSEEDRPRKCTIL